MWKNPASVWGQETRWSLTDSHVGIFSCSLVLLPAFRSGNSLGLAWKICLFLFSISCSPIHCLMWNLHKNLENSRVIPLYFHTVFPYYALVSPILKISFTSYHLWLLVPLFCSLHELPEWDFYPYCPTFPTVSYFSPPRVLISPLKPHGSLWVSNNLYVLSSS